MDLSIDTAVELAGRRHFMTTVKIIAVEEVGSVIPDMPSWTCVNRETCMNEKSFEIFSQLFRLRRSF